MDSYRICITQAIEFAAFIHAHRAKTALPGCNNAFARTQKALHAAILESLPITCRMQHWLIRRFLSLRSYQNISQTE
jgi:hypothetical protein